MCIVEAEEDNTRFLSKTYVNDEPRFEQRDYRGIFTRVVNPGPFNIIRATVAYSSPTAGATPGIIYGGVCSGDFKPNDYSDVSEIPFYTSGSIPLPSMNKPYTIDIKLDTIVDTQEEYLYIAIWNTDGTGEWIKSVINWSVVAANEDHPNYYIRRKRSSSNECYVSKDYKTNDVAAAFALYFAGVPSDAVDISPLSGVPFTTYVEGENPLAVLKPDGGYCGIFNTIACIGDGLTDGVYEHNETGKLEYALLGDYSYPAYMQRALGNTVYKYARGGAGSKDTLKRIVDDNWIKKYPSDCYIIALGTNDMVYPDPMTGEVEDINTRDMTLTDTTTDIGAFGKLVQLIRQRIPKSKVFVVTVPYTRNTEKQVTETNVKLRALAELLDCYVIDLGRHGVQYEDKKEFRKYFYIGGHLNTLGYKNLSVWIMTYIDWIIRHNPGDFTQVAFTQTEYEYIK